MKFRDLSASEIDVRVAMVKESGISLLLYKDARCDMNILDEAVGAPNWTRHHEVINGNLFCNVGIKVEKGDGREFGEWVFKQDVGTESYTEKEKGQASDSFKRACFNWGIGRELYTAPFIWITAKNCNITSDKKCYDKFIVSHVKITDKRIVELEIINAKTNTVVYSYRNTSDTPTQDSGQVDIAAPKIDKNKITVIKKELERTGVSEGAICSRYKVSKIEDITEGVFPVVMKALKSTKTKEVKENAAN